MCNEATEKSKGNVVLIEKNNQLSYNITYKTRLVAADDYDIQGFDAFYGFISGMCASNYDITDIFIDSTLKIAGQDFDKLGFHREAGYPVRKVQYKHCVDGFGG